jgi:hypothetical protein
MKKEILTVKEMAADFPMSSKPIQRAYLKGGLLALSVLYLDTSD